MERTQVILVSGYSLADCQQSVRAFLRLRASNLSAERVAIVARHPRNPVVNVAALGQPDLAAYEKRYNRLAIDVGLYEKVGITSADWDRLLHRATIESVVYLFWLVVDPVGDASLYSPRHDLPRYCWPPNRDGLVKLHITDTGDRVDIQLTDDVAVPPEPVKATLSVRPPSILAQQSGDRTPRALSPVSGTESVTSVAKRAAHATNGVQNKGNDKKVC